MGYQLYTMHNQIFELESKIFDLYTYCHNLQAQITHGILVDNGPKTQLSYRKLDLTETSENTTMVPDDGSSVEVIENETEK